MRKVGWIITKDGGPWQAPRTPRRPKGGTWTPARAAELDRQDAALRPRPRPQRPLARARRFTAEAEDAALRRAEEFACGNYR